MIIRPIEMGDMPSVVEFCRPIIRAGETYALPRDMSDAAIADYWLAADREGFVCELDGVVHGVSYLRPNQLGAGAHIANAGFMTSTTSSGKGIASALCEHVIERARARGFRGMQFNLVVATNTRAVQLWQRHGFAIVGTLPGVFEHPRDGFVDAFVMFRALVGE